MPCDLVWAAGGVCWDQWGEEAVKGELFICNIEMNTKKWTKPSHSLTFMATSKTDYLQCICGEAVKGELFKYKIENENIKRKNG